MEVTILRNRYRVVKRLGTGGGGSVYAVDDLRSTDGFQPVALKALFLGDRNERLLLELLQQEFRVLATLRHPLLARVYDFGRLPENSGLEGATSRPAYFYTRDLIDGEDLSTFCSERSVLEICTVCHHTAEALDVLHRAGMVHRDFKPGNVIVSKDGRPHLIDFGLAQGEGTASQTAGTAQYFAPEMIRGDRIDRRADLYAFGISLYQLLVGELPLPKANFPQLVQWHLDGPPLKISPRRDVPSELDRLVQRLTSRDPDQRYPSAAELALALAEVVAVLGSVPPTSEREPFVPPAPGETLTEPLTQLERIVGDRTLRKRPGPPVIAVIAEPGGGKTTFLRELAWRCQVAGIEVIRAQFQAGDPRPYGVLVDVLSQVAGAVGLSHPLLQGDPSDPEKRDRYGLYEEIREHLSAAARRAPILLLLDAVEQADEESRAALRFLAHTLEPTIPLIAVAAYAPDPQLDAVLGDPPRIEIDALPLAEVGRMLTDASARSDPELAERIYQHTGGNPLFTMEVLSKLSEARWPTAPNLNVLAPPHSLEEVYARRWAELPSEEQEVLAALAVFARPASGVLLLRFIEEAGAGAASSSERSLVGLPLEHLETAAWLVRTPGGAWAFRQAAAAHFVLGATSPEQLKRLHLVAARLGTNAASLATRPPTASRGDGVDVIEHTRHALAAGEIALARESLEPALVALRALGSHRRAIDLLQQAIGLTTDDDERRRLRCQLGEIYRIAGDFKSAEEQLELACEAAEGSELADTRIALAQVYRAAGDTDRALSTLAAVLTGRLTPTQRLAAHTARVATLVALDDHETVLQAVDEGLRIEQEAATQGQPDAATRAELRGRLAWALGHLERYKEATEAFAAALQDAHAAGDQRAEANILNRWAAVAVLWMDYERVTDRYNRALDRAREVGDVERVAAIRFNLAVFHLRRGQYAACLTHLEQSLRLFEAMGAEQNAATARCNLGYLELKLGLYEQARVTLREAVKRMHRLGRRSGEALAILLSALVAARRGKLDEAREGIAEARRISQEQGQRRDAADALLDLAEVELLQDQPGAAAEALKQAAAEVDLDQFADLKARAITLEARAAAQGESTKARDTVGEMLREALAKAKQLDSPELLWQCHGAAMELAAAQAKMNKATSHAVAGTGILGSMADGLPASVQAAFWQDPWRRALRSRAHASRTYAGGESASMLGATMLAGSTNVAAIPVPHSTTPPTSSAQAATPPDSRSEPPLSSSTLRPISSHPSYTSARDLISSVSERFYRLLEIYRRVNSELDPERLLGLVMDTAVELTGAERGFLLLGPEPAKLKMEIARNLDPNNTSHSYSRSIAEQVATTGEPVITVSAHNDPRFDEFASVHQLQLESVLCIPIHAQDALTGVLYMESRFQSGRFTPDDQRLLMAFGDQVAIALTNARLLAENLRKTKELELAYREIEALADQRGRLLNQRTAELEEAQRDLAETRRLLETQTGKHGMVGRSGALLKIYELIDRVAPTDVPVLIEGESGTGKEMVARAIHSASPRKKGRLVSVNCAAIPENLLESELFGHVRGAFTGADRDRKGLFSAADGGTLFLDEIGDMPARMQVDLLRALQEKIIRPVGGAKDIQVDVRVIAASNRSLSEAVKQGSFREDLFYRLHVIRLALPALRERTDDIPLLVEHFLGAIAARMKCDKPRITKQALRRLMSYEWPGNVRQLEHTLMNAVVLAEGSILDEDDFTLESPLAGGAPEPARPLEETDRHQREREEILSALARANWNKSRAAEALGIPRRTFYRRLRTYGIQ